MSLGSKDEPVGMGHDKTALPSFYMISTAKKYGEKLKKQNIQLLTKICCFIFKNTL